MTENVQSVAELRPGQTINLVIDEERTTLLGTKTVTQVKEVLTYEQILESFRRKNEPVKRNNIVPMEAREFNRYAALAQTGVEQGKWLGGTAVDAKKIGTDLVAKIKALPDTMHQFVNDKARAHLKAVAANKTLGTEQKKEIKDFLAKFDTPAA